MVEGLGTSIVCQFSWLCDALGCSSTKAGSRVSLYISSPYSHMVSFPSWFSQSFILSFVFWLGISNSHGCLDEACLLWGDVCSNFLTFLLQYGLVSFCLLLVSPFCVWNICPAFSSTRWAICIVGNN